MARARIIKPALLKNEFLGTAEPISVVPSVNPLLREHRADMVRWALPRCRAAIFADYGLSKGPTQIEWETRSHCLNARQRNGR